MTSFELVGLLGSNLAEADKYRESAAVDLRKAITALARSEQIIKGPSPHVLTDKMGESITVQKNNLQDALNILEKIRD